ncbi:MAG: rod shape-determining protein [Planctomycetes bacterium]|nr:rod shape-determining protein [Planctomycetota bacterium]
MAERKKEPAARGREGREEGEGTDSTDSPGSRDTHPTHPKDHGVLYVGIDLGTSRTSVAASNGVRETVLSYVGYPKDVVSRKLLKKDVLFGGEALERRLSLNLFRPLAKGVIKYGEMGNGVDVQEVESNRQAARDLIREAIARARPRKDELIYGVIGAPAQASIHNKKTMIDATREVLDAVMVCSEPFSVAYGLDILDDALVIDIGAGTTDLCRMHGTLPDAEDQITLTTAGDYIDQELHRRLQAHCRGASFSIEMVKDIKEKYSHVTDTSDPVRVELPVDGRPHTFDITEEVREACRSIVGPLVEALDKLVASFHPEFQHRLRNNVLLGGGGSQIRGLGRAIEEALQELGGGRVRTVEEPIYAGANGALKMAHDMPAEYWEQLR